MGPVLRRPLEHLDVRVAGSRAFVPASQKVRPFRDQHDLVRWPMDPSEFRIGELTFADRRWRCTAIGSSVSVAYRVDAVQITRSVFGEEPVANGAIAQAGGWFDGPPHGAVEHVFDEHDLDAGAPAA